MSTKHKINWGLVLTLVALLAGWEASGCRSYADVEHRISVIETKQEDGDKRLERLEGKIDRILERVTK